MLESLWKKKQSAEKPEQAVPVPAVPSRDDAVLAEILSNLHELTKQLNDKILAVENRVKATEVKLEKSDQSAELKERIAKLEKQLEEFTSIYEVISSQYNPFISKQTPKEIALTPERPAQLPVATPQAQTEPEVQKLPPVAAEVAPQAKVPVQKQEFVVEEAIANKIMPPDGFFVEESFTVQRQGHQITRKSASANLAEHDAQADLVADLTIEAKTQIQQAILEERMADADSRLTVKAPPGQEFRIDGVVQLSCIADLAAVLINENTSHYFHRFVNDEHDDFACWIEGSLGLTQMAVELRSLKSIDPYVLALLRA